MSINMNFLFSSEVDKGPLTRSSKRPLEVEERLSFTGLEHRTGIAVSASAKVQSSAEPLWSKMFVKFVKCFSIL